MDDLSPRAKRKIEELLVQEIANLERWKFIMRRGEELGRSKKWFKQSEAYKEEIETSIQDLRVIIATL